MRYANVIILLPLFLFSFSNSVAQQDNHYIFRHIDQSNGLLHNQVFSITQDAKGYIWVLSPNGLQQYDGARFITPPDDPHNIAGISYSQDCHLFSDNKNNRLWIANENIEQLDLQKKMFRYYNRAELLKDSLIKFEAYEDSTGHPWYAGNFGFFDNISNTNKFPHFFCASSLNQNTSSNFIVDKNKDRMWLALWSAGLFLFDKKTKKIYTHSVNPLNDPFLRLMDKKGIFYLYQDVDKNIWITTSIPEFYKFDPLANKITAYSLSKIKNGNEKNKDVSLMVHCIFEDNHHELWIGTQNAGLLKLDKKTGKFINVSGRINRNQDISYNYDIFCIFQDKDENIWLGTDKGISIFNPYHQYFNTIYHDKDNASSLPENEIEKCIETVNGDILVGTWGGGITVYDNQWHFKKTIRFHDEIWEKNFVWSFIQNDDGMIWAGCQHSYIHIYDPIKETIKTIMPAELSGFTIHCMKKDKDGNIFFGLHNGRIAKWNKTENKFYAYSNSLPGLSQSFTPVISIYVDEKQNCWAGTEDGLKYFDAGKMCFTEIYMHDKKNSYEGSVNMIQSIDKLNDSTLVLGTAHGGMVLFNTLSKKFFHFPDTPGLSNITINNVKKDKDNNIWYTTDYDLYKYVVKEKKTIKYNIDHGIVNATFKAGNFYALKDGRWVTNTSTEIICFNPDSLQKREPVSLEVNITGFKVFDKDIFIDSLLYSGKPVKLTYEQNFLSIEYGALDFSGLLETKYYYQLEGINKDWVYAGTQRVANYTNLDPGEYIFHVRAGNKTTDQTTSFKIIITPPLWKTIWFRMVLILLTAYITWLIFRKRVNIIRHEAELKQRIAETEMMALRAQMNPHFIFNCINSIDAMIQSNDKYQATVYLNKFAKLIRNILDSSKQNVVTLSKDMETLQLYIDLEKFRNENKFTVEINADKNLLQDDYKIPPLIIQPYVENAILHGLKNRLDNNGRLLIAVEKENNRIHFSIEDNGVGRRATSGVKQDSKCSYGIQISSDRIKLFNKEDTASVFITDLEKDGEAAGTKVEVFLNI